MLLCFTDRNVCAAFRSDLNIPGLGDDQLFVLGDQFLGGRLVLGPGHVLQVLFLDAGIPELPGQVEDLRPAELVLHIRPGIGRQRHPQARHHPAVVALEGG